MRMLNILTAGVALLSASAAFAQSSKDTLSEGRSVGHSSGHARTAPHAATTRAVSSRASGRNRSSETCGQGVGPTTDHEPVAVTGKSPASPPESGAADQHGGPVTPCPPHGRS